MKHAAIALSLSLLAATAFAALDSSDKTILKKLSQANSSEVDLAKVVEPHATHADVKAYAKRMIDDHGKALKELDRIADAEKVPMKTAEDAEHKEMAAKLAKEKHGMPYDRTYIDEMVKDHEKDKSDVEKAIKEIKNPALKSQAESELKTIETHLELAKELQVKLK